MSEPGPAPNDDAPAAVRRPAAGPGRFVFASPHSGRDYPDGFLAVSALPLNLLRRSEDAYVDELFAEAPARGASLITARFPRAYVDVNRAPDEFDPAMFEPPAEGFAPLTPRAAAGLGVIPRVAADGRAIHRGPLTRTQAQARLAACYRPYHAALRAELSASAAAWGQAILIDCHSMPSASARGADVVLGDRFGAACSRRLADEAEAAFRALGLKVARNRPYAGGYVTEHYGRPAQGVQALQVEISRGLYLDELAVTPAAGFAPLRALVSSWMTALMGAMDESGRMAAE